MRGRRNREREQGEDGHDGNDHAVDDDVSYEEEDEHDSEMWLMLVTVMARHDGADYEGEKQEQHVKEAQEDEHSVVRRSSIRDH